MTPPAFRAEEGHDHHRGFAAASVRAWLEAYRRDRLRRCRQRRARCQLQVMTPGSPHRARRHHARSTPRSAWWSEATRAFRPHRQSHKQRGPLHRQAVHGVHAQTTIAADHRASTWPASSTSPSARFAQMLAPGQRAHRQHHAPAWSTTPTVTRPAALASLTKGGLAAVTRSLAIEYASRGVRVNAVSPGVIKTPMHDPESLRGARRAAPHRSAGRDQRRRRRDPLSRTCHVRHRRDPAHRRRTERRTLIVRLGTSMDAVLRAGRLAMTGGAGATRGVTNELH